MNVTVAMVGVGLLGFLITIGTAWQGKFRTAAGVGILTGALLVVCMFVFRPSSQDSTAGSLLWAPAAAPVRLSLLNESTVDYG